MMKPEVSRRVPNVLCAFTLVLITTLPASAQWTAGDTKNAWNGYLSAYQYTGAAGYDYLFATTIGGSSHDAFWVMAEEIDMAVDAYVWAETNDSSNLSTYENEVEGLCDGFVSVHPDSEGGGSWASETSYNDDLDVATIAFARAYKVTGTTRWLTDAEDASNEVWSRGQEGNGGLCQSTSGCYENSSVNWTFVIAGRLINSYNGGTGSYLSETEGVYTWAKANLYDSSTGEIYDAAGGVTGNYTYNYGFAIGAMSESGESATTIGQVATYLFNDMTSYAGTTSGGYNILPNYGQGATDNDGGYNGIVMRWINTANAHGSIPSADLAAAKANVTQAWSVREYTSTYPDYLMWDNWETAPENNNAYILANVFSWDCSSALVGMLDGQGW
jgi:predicted alpha-1,6-mannanase (GH76 family)